jgi:hypothetical protein
MTVTIHPRESGATVRCGRCSHSLTTGQIQVKLIRAYAASLGWIRGLRKSKWKPPGEEYMLPANRRQDICPACAPAEREECDLRRRLDAERKVKRDTKRKERDEIMRHPRELRQA